MSLTTIAPEFAVYVHWPFCLSKCPYCDFNSHVRHGGYDEAHYVRAIQSEIAAAAERAPGRIVSTIFFGGGTPSLMQPQTVGAILDSVGKHWTVAGNVEVSLEANPTSVEATRFRGYRAAGVNRVSLGVQALDDQSLKELGRLHSAQEALDIRALFVRSDLRAAAPDARRLEDRTQASDLGSGRTSLTLSTDHRAGHAVLRPAQGRQVDRT